MKASITWGLIFALLLGPPALAEIVPAIASPVREFVRDEDLNLIVLTEDDLSPENICQSVWAVIAGSVGADDAILEIAVEGDALRITLDWPESAIPPSCTAEDYARDRIGSVTDSILRCDQLDRFWGDIVVEFPQGSATLKKQMIAPSEFGRCYEEFQIEMN